MCNETLKYLPQLSRAFQIDFRLSQGPPLPVEAPFPAALIDVIAGYHYLVNTLGFEPRNICILGESAGGTLAIALIRYLIMYIPSLPPPGSMFLLSPTADWGSSHMGQGSSFQSHMKSDFIRNFFLSGYPVRALLGNLPASTVDTSFWISPASHHLGKTAGLFAGFPPTLIVSGSAELTLDAMKTLRDRMETDIGEDVTYLEAPESSHTLLSYAWHEPEKTETFAKVEKWYSSLSIA